MLVKIKLFGPMKNAFKADKVIINLPENAKIEDLLESLENETKTLYKRDYGVKFEVLLNDANIRGLGGLKAQLNNGDTLSIIPVVEGG